MSTTLHCVSEGHKTHAINNCLQLHTVQHRQFNHSHVSSYRDWRFSYWITT